MRLAIAILVVGTFLSCDSPQKKESKKKQEKKSYEMYEPSEMASYMHVIHDLNEEVKSSILAGKTPTDFPEKILEIHSAEMTKADGRNETFQKFSHLFVERMELVFDTTSNVPLKQRYNDAINLCVSCHQTECTGPIPRIKKLLIH